MLPSLSPRPTAILPIRHRKPLDNYTPAHQTILKNHPTAIKNDPSDLKSDQTDMILVPIVLNDYRFTLFQVLFRAKCSFFSTVGSVFIAVGLILDTVGSWVLLFVNRFHCRLVIWKCRWLVCSWCSMWFVSNSCRETLSFALAE